MCVVHIPRSRCTGNALNFFYSDGAAVDGSTLPTDNAPGNPANSRPLEPRQPGGNEGCAISAHMPPRARPWRRPAPELRIADCRSAAGATRLLTCSTQRPSAEDMSEKRRNDGSRYKRRGCPLISGRRYCWSMALHTIQEAKVSAASSTLEQRLVLTCKADISCCNMRHCILASFLCS